jgi:Bifunctional DNA primase/polymerase, N-terminal
MTKSFFAKWAPIYRERGLEPRPVKPGGKGCYLKGWTKPDSELSQAELDRWLIKYANYGIGLRMGTPLPGGGHLGALDIDNDGYVRISKVLMGNPPCMRIGKKGVVIFTRIIGDLPNSTFKVKREDEPDLQVADCLFDKKLCVIPPTIHPGTKKPYRWIGTPLHQLDFDLLPVIGE